MPDSLSPYADPPLVRGADGWALVQGEPPPVEGGPVQNTDRELWRDPDSDPDEAYRDRLFVTADNLVGISVGGYVQLRPLRAWAELASMALKRAATSSPAPGVKYDDTRGPTVQVGDGMVMHPDPEATVWLALDGKGVGHSVAEWLELVQLLGRLSDAGEGAASETDETRHLRWERLEVLRILAAAGVEPAEAWPNLARSLVAFVTAEQPDLLPGQTGGPPLGPDLDYAWCERIAERTKVDLGAVALIIGAHLELQQEAR
jgi:hypothetical protein